MPAPLVAAAAGVGIRAALPAIGRMLGAQFARTAAVRVGASEASSLTAARVGGQAGQYAGLKTGHRVASFVEGHGQQQQSYY